MKKLFYIFVGVLVVGVMGCGHWPWDRGEKESENVLVNPGFDKSPWNSGWVIDTATSWERDSLSYTSADVSVNSDSGIFSPKCCCLRTYSLANCTGDGIGRYAIAGANGMISQMFDVVDGYKLKARVNFSYVFDSRAQSGCEIEVHTNGEWISVWDKSDLDSLGKWVEILIESESQIDGIRFCVYSSAYVSGVNIGCQSSYGSFRVDDIYVGKYEE